MLRKVSETFTATHMVVMFAIAVLAPGALYAAASLTNVAITDPSSGASAMVDAQRRMRIYDQSADYTKNPLFAVNISTSNTGLVHRRLYTIPAGKVLIIKSVTWSFAQDNAVQMSLDLSLNPSGQNFIFFYELLAAAISGSISPMMDPGLIVRAGDLYEDVAASSDAEMQTFIQGYLVPDTAVPAPSSAEAAQQFVNSARAPIRRRSP